MSVYKVIQDVEAEDKLLGPLTFKAFIYALIAGFCLFINYRLLIIASSAKWVILPFFFFPMVLFGVLASPLGRDQPTEVWLLSKIKFFLKTRKRVWDQSGMEELVTITAPKKFEQHLTKDITQNEVHSRLKTLASTLDTRGWAIKNVNVNLNITPPGPTVSPSSDRLVSPMGDSQLTPGLVINPADDILDEENNPTAQKFASMMEDADNKRRRTVLDTMRGLLDSTGQERELKLPAANSELQQKLAQARASFHKEHIEAKQKPLPPKSPAAAVKKEPEIPKTAPVTPEHQAVNMELAQSGSAFSVSTLSQLANHQPLKEQAGSNEITISLH